MSRSDSIITITPGSAGRTTIKCPLTTVEWAEPENPGPPITDYDVQCREGPSGFFINAPHEGPGRTATLTGLKAATLYQVQVRASNEEGTGRWSQPGEGLTLAGPAAVLPFSVPDRGGISFTSQGTSPELRVGYGQVETDDGMTPPVGLAIFGSRLNGILASEVGVPASAAVLEGRIFAETDGPVRNGLALANTSGAPTTVRLELTELDGTATGSTESLTIPASGHVARFIDEFFPALTTPFSGILRIVSTVPDIAAAALTVPGGGVLEEQLAEMVRRDAPALVGDRDRHMQPLALRRDPDAGGFRRVAPGVGQQVVEHLHRALPVGHDPGQAGRQVDAPGVPPAAADERAAGPGAQLGVWARKMTASTGNMIIIREEIFKYDPIQDCCGHLADPHYPDDTGDRTG